MAGHLLEKHLVSVGSRELEGILRLAGDPIGLVIFAHGAGSSRLSPRNNHVAEELGRRRIATLLFDLLTEPEAADRRNVFDIPLLAGRVLDAVRWAGAEARLAGLHIGLFGSSTGAGAALVAAAEAPGTVAAVVSRGGRPDLAGPALARVQAPTLLIVGGLDTVVIDLNRSAARVLSCVHRLVIVPGATHLFEEHGTLDEVVRHAGDWFEEHLQERGVQ